MKILLHALGSTMGGAVRHLTNFLPELSVQDPDREYVVYVRDSFPDVDLPNVRLQRVSNRQASGAIPRVYLDLVQVPRMLVREGYGAVVSLMNFGPVWTPVPHLLFQRNSLYFCSHYLSQIRGKARCVTALRRQLAVASMTRANLVVTPSRSMAKMIEATCPGADQSKFRTLLHGFDPASLAAPLDPKYREVLEAQEGYRFLYPTHPAPHKGFEVLFDALAALREREPNFRLFTTIERADWPEVVAPYEARIQELGLREHVLLIGRVPQEQMGALYEACDLMVYPSLCESFGFSMIEAMGHGLPIVAAATEVNQEMCEAGASYYPPGDADAAAEAILATLDEARLAEVREAGQRRARDTDWSWARYAREFSALLDEVV